MLISFSPIRWFPRRFHWRVRITEFVWNSHFCDVQIQGPFAQFRHRHSIRPEVRDGVDGTLITDEIDFALPFGLIGRLGNATVRRLLAKSFGHRQQRLPEALVFAARLAAESR
jgi:ligand-binding SRPBCC domain-containing protein